MRAVRPHQLEAVAGVREEPTERLAQAGRALVVEEALGAPAGEEGVLQAEDHEQHHLLPRERAHVTAEPVQPHRRSRAAAGRDQQRAQRDERLQQREEQHEDDERPRVDEVPVATSADDAWLQRMQRFR